MGIFGFKKSSDDKKPDPAPGGASAAAGAAAPAGGAASAPEAFSPEKAQRFFVHAKTVFETGNHEYAIQLWLSGLKFDPTAMSGMEGFFKAVAAFMNKTEGKGRLSKDVSKPLSEGKPVDRYLTALLEWGTHPFDPVPAVRSAELGANLGLKEPTHWIAERAFAAISRDKRPRKDLYLKLKEACAKAGSFELSVQAAEAALRLDPSDGALAAEIRNLSAQATMNKGGYERSGEEGGFRQNIKDADKQRMLEAQDAIVKTGDTLDRLIQSAEEDHVKRPTDIQSAQVLIKRLQERGKPDDYARALKLMDEMYALSKQFTFREQAGDLRMRIARRRLAALKETADSRPTDAAARSAYDKAQRDFLEFELEEYRVRVDAYPTDLGRKFTLGEKYYSLGLTDDAIALFQESQSDPKLRGNSLKYLGLSFMKIGWLAEAVETFRRSLESRDLMPDLQLEIKYWLMRSLKDKAAHDRDIGHADEADKIASSIAIQQITYRDIRQQRDELKKLIADLRAAGAIGGGGGASGGGSSGS